MARRKRPGTVQLLREQDTCQAVWQRQIRQRPDEVGTLAAVIRHAVRTTDNESQVATVRLPPGQSSCKRLAGQLFASLIEQHGLLITGELTEYQLAFGLDRTS